MNNDGEVNIADINALIDIILTGKPVDDCTFWRADVAEDNELGIADINALIDFILNGGGTRPADVNGDGEISISDVNAAIDIILQ